MHLFPSQIPNIPLAGRLKFFYKNWEKLTKDPRILSMVKGRKIQFRAATSNSRFPLPQTTQFGSKAGVSSSTGKNLKKPKQAHTILQDRTW